MSIVDLGPGAQRLAGLVARVGDDELGKPTPCPSYTLGDLTEHVGGLALAFAAAANKETGSYAEGQPSGDASRLGEDWRVRIPRDLATLAEAWRDPAAWAGMTRIAGSDSPAEVVGLVAADELVVHGWDVARATGQPYDCEPELLAAAESFLAMFASPDAPARRSSTAWSRSPGATPGGHPADRGRRPPGGRPLRCIRAAPGS
jgi:uncharacterized protein (TIGR03086 family)